MIDVVMHLNMSFRFKAWQNWHFVYMYHLSEILEEKNVNDWDLWSHESSLGVKSEWDVLHVI